MAASDVLLASALAKVAQGDRDLSAAAVRRYLLRDGTPLSTSPHYAGECFRRRAGAVGEGAPRAEGAGGVAFQMNYQKAADVQKLLSDASQRILSKRGSAVVDARTNTLFVQDTPTRLEEVRKLIAKIDVAVRQVMIEARIVEASDNFFNEPGRAARLHTTRRPRRGFPAAAAGSTTRFELGRQPGNVDAGSRGRRAGHARPSSTSGLQRQPAGGGPERRSTPGAFSLRPVQPGPDAVPQPGDLGAGSRRQGQDHLQPARADRRPGRGADRAGHGDPLPAGDLLGRHLGVVQQGEPVAQGEAADHARRQRHHDARRQQGPAGRDDAGRRRRSTPSTSRPRCWSRTAARW